MARKRLIDDKGLWKILRAGEVPEAELAYVLGSHFGSAEQKGPDEITFPGGDKFALRLVYGNDELIRVEQGELLSNTDIEALQGAASQLTVASEPICARMILFSQLPVEGGWRHRDELQFIPAPENAPRPPVAIGDHPFLLEFKIASSLNRGIVTLRKQARSNELMLLVSTLLSPTPTEPRLDFHWMLVSTDEPDRTSIAWLQQFYSVEGFQYEQADLSKGDFQQLQVEAAQDYYNQEGIHVGDPMRVPSSLGESLDAYFALPDADRVRFQRACFWFRHAIGIRLSKSAFFMALINAIESIAPAPGDQERCLTCQSITGVTKRFRNLVDELEPEVGDRSNRARKSLYDTRSRIAHGDLVFRSDTDARIGPMHPLATEQDLMSSDVLHITQIALVNWLHTHGATSPKLPLIEHRPPRRTPFFVTKTIGTEPTRII